MLSLRVSYSKDSLRVRGGLITFQRDKEVISTIPMEIKPVLPIFDPILVST